MLRNIAALVCCTACCILTIHAQGKPNPPKKAEWFEEEPRGRSAENPNAKKLPRIHVAGNRFVDAKGDTLLFRGLSISDPDKLEYQGHWNRMHFLKVKEMGTMLVRIPVHPIAWQHRTPGNYLLLLDQAVDWCTELGMYVIIDWHSIGNLGMELFQDPMYNTSRRETYEFWRTIAQHFRGNNTVAFYELFNEPTLFKGQLGTMPWSEWKDIVEKMIHVVRAYDPEVIPLVAGLDWAYDLTPLHDDPINAQGIGYVTHPYPHKRTVPYEPKWEEDFGFAAETYPLIATEIGFTLGREGMQENGDYGRSIIRYLEGKGISWTAWVFDPQWTPRLIESADTYKLTESGQFFRDAMKGKLVK